MSSAPRLRPPTLPTPTSIQRSSLLLLLAVGPSTVAFTFETCLSNPKKGSALAATHPIPQKRKHNRTSRKTLRNFTPHSSSHSLLPSCRSIPEIAHLGLQTRNGFLGVPLGVHERIGLGFLVAQRCSRALRGAGRERGGVR